MFSRDASQIYISERELHAATKDSKCDEIPSEAARCNSGHPLLTNAHHSASLCCHSQSTYLEIAPSSLCNLLNEFSVPFSLQIRPLGIILSASQPFSFLQRKYFGTSLTYVSWCEWRIQMNKLYQQFKIVQILSVCLRTCGSVLQLALVPWRDSICPHFTRRF